MSTFTGILKTGIWILLILPLWVCAQATGEAALADKYFDDGEYAEALPLYEKLYKGDAANKHYSYRIVSCHDKLRSYDDAIRFLDKALRQDPVAFDLEILKSVMYEKKGDRKEMEKILKNLIYNKLRTINDFGSVAVFFTGLNSFDRAEETYLQGRKVQKSDNLFAEELGALYDRMGKYGQAATEYLRMSAFDPSTMPGVRTKILNMVNPQSSASIEQVLLDAVQKNQKEPGLRALIFEFYVQNEQFMEAFMQVKSIDKVFAENGERVFQFAMTMRTNHNYSLSNKALDYIIENHRDSPYYFTAYKEKTVNGEMEAFEKVPLDSAAIRTAVAAYEDLLGTFGRTTVFFDAIYRKARLQAFYLFELDAALRELNDAVAMPIKPKEKAEANLLIGDIYLMKKEFAKAKLKYGEVDQQYKDEQIGALAKFKDGQLSYFKGDFEEAQARLKSIKDNTSNDISNDAIRLFLLIQDNTGLDSNTTALQKFANAQLLVFQRDYTQAWAILDSLEYEFPNHPLADEILWEKANIQLARGQTTEAMSLLSRILEKFGTDIYGDDALYTMARIEDYNYKQPEKAMELYLRMLRDYPGSLYSVSVRKRIRELRKEKI